jgi:arginine/lysine/ornithine decarboxylase
MPNSSSTYSQYFPPSVNSLPAIIQIDFDITLDETHYTILVDASGGNITIALPNASTYDGRIYNIKKIDNTANTVTINPSGIQPIDGASTYIITIQWTSIQIQAGNTNAWYII